MDVALIVVGVVLGLVWVVWRHKRRMARVEAARQEAVGSPEAALVEALMAYGGGKGSAAAVEAAAAVTPDARLAREMLEAIRQLGEPGEPGLVATGLAGLAGLLLDTDVIGFGSLSKEELRQLATRRYLAAAWLAGRGLAAEEDADRLGLLIESKSLCAAAAVPLTRSESSDAAAHQRILRYQQTLLGALRAAVQ